MLGLAHKPGCRGFGLGVRRTNYTQPIKISAKPRVQPAPEQAIKIAVLVSGGGTNFQALIDAQSRGELMGGRLSLCISSQPSAYALKRAEAAGIQAVVAERKQGQSHDAYADQLIEILQAHEIDLIVLAGFLVILGRRLTQLYKDRILNVHPSLIPAFCGEGFYGLAVHKAALDYGVKVTGATVHYVSEVVDGGQILLQKAVDVLPGDTPQTLQRRVMEQAEWLILPKAVSLVCKQLIKDECNEKTSID